MTDAYFFIFGLLPEISYFIFRFSPSFPFIFIFFLFAASVVVAVLCRLAWRRLLLAHFIRSIKFTLTDAP
jgi:cytochrome c oxidase subunit IV